MKMNKFSAIALLFLIGSPALAEMSKHEDALCEKHCQLMDLEKKVEALKKSEKTADKLATKEHLKKDIEGYEKKLQELKLRLEEK